MATNRRESMLQAATVLVWLGAVAAVAAAIWLPYRLPSADATLPAAEPLVPATVPAATIGSLDDVLDVNLRRPLVDAPARAPATAVAPTLAPGPGVRLAGIVAEPGRSYAVLVTSAGTTEVRAVGQRVAGAEVVAIGPSAVTVRFAGRTTTLSLPPRNSPGRP